MNISRFEPWSLINMLHQNVDPFVGRRSGVAVAENGETAGATWIPAVDIVEEKDRFVLRADLPGVKPEDIDINMEKGVLTISGKRVEQSYGETEGAKRLERASGKFSRRFSLPDTANADDISAQSVNGILDVEVPKHPEVQARRITVKAA